MGMTLRRAFRYAWRLLELGLIVFLITLFAVFMAERYALATYTPERIGRVDALIVLGGGVEPDYVLNYVGRERADTAASLLGAGRAEVAIFTGTFERFDRPEGEAGLMRNRVSAAGIQTTRLFLEPDARTTLENLRFSFALAEAQGHRTFAIVTDAYHLPRALALSALLNGENVTGVASIGLDEHGAFTRLAFLGREALAWWYNLGKAAAWSLLGLAGMSEAERGQWIV
ncbi:MAG: YdcF family protein [Pseudomonadota bacterium]